MTDEYSELSKKLDDLALFVISEYFARRNLTRDQATELLEDFAERCEIYVEEVYDEKDMKEELE